MDILEFYAYIFCCIHVITHSLDAREKEKKTEKSFSFTPRLS